MRQKLLFFLLLYGAGCEIGLLGSSTQQNLIIIYEYGHVENIDKTLNEKVSDDEHNPLGLGAASCMLLIALYQRAAPILVPAPLWNTILAHRKLFNRYLSDSTTVLNKHYGSTVRFANRNKVAEFKDTCCYVQELYKALEEHIPHINTPESLEKKIWCDLRFDKKNASSYCGSRYDDLMSEVQTYLMCAHIPLQWYWVKKVTEPTSGCEFFLFIPKPLLSSCDGLKLTSYEDVLTSDLLTPKEGIPACYDETLIAVLKMILKGKKSGHNWVFYLVGHGSFSEDAYQQLMHEEREHDSCKQQIQQQLEEEQKWISIMQDYADRIAKKGSRDKDFLIRNHEIARKNSVICRKRCQAIERNRKIVEQNIQDLRGANTIAGISAGHFNSLLTFFNEYCNTKLFFYSSCSAGGKHSVDPYRNALTYKPLMLSYCVIVDTLTEAPSHSICPRMPLSYYSDVHNYYYYAVPSRELVDWDYRIVTCKSSYDFKTFFQKAHAASSKESVKSLLKAVCPMYKIFCKNDEQSETQVTNWIERGYKKVCTWYDSIKKMWRQDGPEKTVPYEELRNLPSIRLSRQAHFRVIDVNSRFLSVSPRFLKKELLGGVCVADTDAILLYAPSIPALKIEKASRDFPAFISMIPGEACHVIDNFEADKSTFSEVVHGFFAINNVKTRKLFYIKKLLCINDLCIKHVPVGSLCSFSDIFLFNRFSKTTLDEKKISGVCFVVGAQFYSLTWDSEKPVPIDLCYRCNKSDEFFHKRFMDAKKDLFRIVAESDAHEVIDLDAIVRGLNSMPGSQ